MIKSELDKLRTMVEKSELWVDKKGSTKGDSTGDGNKKEKKEVRALSKTLGSRVGKEWEGGGLLTLMMPLDGEAPGGSCGVWLEGHSVTPVLLCPLQHGADEEVIAPGEKSSENYQIVKGVSETKPQCLAGRKGVKSWGNFQVLLCFSRNKSKPGLFLPAQHREKLSHPCTVG